MAANNNLIGFRLVNISVQQFAIVEDAFNENEIGKTNVNTTLKFIPDKAHKVISAFILIKYEQQSSPFIIIEVGCHFQIEDKSWAQVLNTTDNSLKMPQDFMGHLAVLTIGTTRGVLFAKTENTNYNRFILPTINVNDLVKGDIPL